MDHDQSFKNLIVDYPRQALELFAPEIAARLPPDAVITPIREEQLKERLGDRFFELDVPLLVELPSGERDAMLVDFEQHTVPSTFRIHKLAHYALLLAEEYKTDRVVPIVVLLKPGRLQTALRLGVDEHTFLTFAYVLCELSKLPAERYLHSSNIVARLNLPNMAFAPERKVDVYDRALRGLGELEQDHEKRRKYFDFVDQYARLTQEERLDWLARKPKKEPTMSWLTEVEQKAKAEGKAEGEAEGEAKGEAKVLRMLTDLVSRGLLTADAARAELDRLVQSGELAETLAEEGRLRLPAGH